MARAVGLRTFSFSTLQLDKSSETADSEKSLRGIPIAVLGFPWPLWKPAIRESRVARLEAALVFSKPFAEELVDFFRVASCFLAAFAGILVGFADILAAFGFMGDIFLLLLLPRLFFFGDWTT